MKPIPLHRHAEAIRNSNLNVKYKGYTIRAMQCGRLEVLAPSLRQIATARTLGEARRIVDRQFEYEGPPAA